MLTWRMQFRNVQGYSQPAVLIIGKNVMILHFTKICNVTHSLLVIGEYVVRLPQTWNICNVTHNLLVIGKDAMRLPVGQKYECNVTHNLLVIGKDVMRLPFTKRCDVTHLLFVIGEYVMRLPFTKMYNVTHLLSVYEKVWWDCLPWTCVMSLTVYGS